MKPPGAGSSFPNFKGPSLLKWIHRSKQVPKPGVHLGDVGHGWASQWGQREQARAPATVPCSIT